MDKARIIEFSNTVRDRLYEETKNRAANYGIFPDKIQDVDKEFEDSIVIGGRVFNRRIKRQREQLVREVREKGYGQLIDEVTYTWFNRFVALKFMEVNGYLPENVKVFSSNEPGKTEPDILSKSLKLDFLNIDRNIVIDLKSGGKDEELYKYLTLSLCNYLNKIMPFLFENIEDHTELLFPDKLLHTDSILRDINRIIKEEDWKEVEVIGWIYQDYINPRKKKVTDDYNKKDIKIAKEDIPAYTQLFTPKWIVKYLVENSVGRLWLESNPNKDLQAKFRYFIEQETRPPEKRIVSPEEISVLDPAKGSGHILVYAFEVLYEIYRSQGYLVSEIAPLILNKNLYGLEIDDRAAQLAGFALMMKARMYDKELFNKNIFLNLCAIQETREGCALNRGKYPELCRLWDFFIDAKNYGSILKVGGFDFERLSGEVELLKKEGTLDSVFVGSKLNELIKQAKLMSRKYFCVVTNPPYMGSGGMNSKLADFVKKQYPDSKSDMFAVFIEKCLDFTIKKGYTSMITMQSWMFLPSFEKLRVKILENFKIDTMVHLGPRAFDSISGEVVSTTAFVIENVQHLEHKGAYLRLINGKNEAEKEAELKAKKSKPFYASASDFKKIPDSPIAYWVSDRVRAIFVSNPLIENIALPKQGSTIGDNNRFLRIWYELVFPWHSKWKKCVKGGDFRRWFGNCLYLVKWGANGEEIKSTGRATIRNSDYLFKSGIEWSRISSTVISFRMMPSEFFHESASGVSFPPIDDCNAILGFFNTKISRYFLGILNPTLTFQSGDISRLPYIRVDCERSVQKLIVLAKIDWNSYETSWDFTTLPILQSNYRQPTLQSTYTKLRAHWREMTLEMQRLEEVNNHIFIEAYGLPDEQTPDVPLSEITLTCNPYYRYNGNKNEEELEALLMTDTIKEFISYAVGCMFGRYSPDKEGLILANKGETIKDFTAKVPAPSFMPGDDNIIPLLDFDYFKDDIVLRFKEFLKVTFGAESLAENLDFIAGALSRTKKGGESSEKIIRDYFLKSFFKDHARTYQKRPIYWLFTSGKGRGFNALVYMHRYDKTLLAKMRTDYLLALEEKLDARMGMLSDSPRDKQEKERLGKLMLELAAYDEKLNNKALAYIDIDLDDGVAVNYAKFEGLVEGI